MPVVSTIAGSVIQNAAYDALAGVSAFYTARMGGRVYTDVPQGAAFPLVWLTFDDPMETSHGTFGQIGRISHLAVHVYSDYSGDDQAIDIMQHAVEILDAGFTVPGWQVVWVNGELPALLEVADLNGRAIRHGIARVDVYAMKAVA